MALAAAPEKARFPETAMVMHRALPVRAALIEAKVLRVFCCSTRASWSGQITAWGVSASGASAARSRMAMRLNMVPIPSGCGNSAPAGDCLPNT